MSATRRYWAVASIVIFLAVTSAAFGQSMLLVGAVGLGGWLLATQYSFVHGLNQLTRDLVVEQAISPAHGRTGEPYHLTVVASRTRRSPLSLSIEPTSPSTAQYHEAVTPRCELDVGDRQSSVVASLAFTVAGTVTFDRPTVTATDRLGLFVVTFERGEAKTVTVDPPLPDDVYVGKTGTTAAGQNQFGPQEFGFDLRDIREYVPSDSMNRINWRLTARLGSPHVVEYEPEIDLKTVLVFDHRPKMAVGTPGRSKLDYNREVALAFVERSQSRSDLIGYYSFDQDSLTNVLDPAPATERARLIRTRLLSEVRADNRSSTRPRRKRGTATAATRNRTRQAAVHLRNDNTPFATAVRPFLTADTSRTVDLTDDPLSSAIRTAQKRISGQLFYVVFTDDSDPERLRESVQLARQGGNEVVVFMTPTVLFDWGELVDLDHVTERYRSFESLRQSLDRLDSVEAFRVAPRERVKVLHSVLERRNSSGEAVTRDDDRGGLHR